MKLTELSNKPVDTVVKTFTTKEFDAIVDYLKANCSQAVRNSTKIVRAISAIHVPAYLADSTKIERRSANTMNYYTWIIDHDPAWNKFPKRSKSFICSIDATYMSGRIYRVFPFDGTQVAFIPGQDIWGHFFDKDVMPHFTALDGFTRFLDELIVAAAKHLNKLDVYKTKQPIYLDFLKQLKVVGDYLNEFKSLKELVDQHGKPSSRSELDALNDSWQHRHDLLTLYRSWLKPKDVKLQSISKLENSRRSECWFSGEAVFIREDLVDRVLEKYAQKE